MDAHRFQGDRLRAVRREMGLDQKSFAKQLGFHEATIQSWEVGRAQPRARMLRYIAELTGLPISHFFGNGRAVVEGETVDAAVEGETADLAQELARWRALLQEGIAVTLAISPKK
jgi:transcriptional regulator with XRE-family HTH domain